MSPKAVNADNPVQVLKLLKKKGRAAASQLGADKPVIDFLISEGFVKKDGTIRVQKGRGRPPIAYVPAFEYDLKDLALEFNVPQQRERKEISQAQLDRVIEDATKHDSNGYGTCQCIAQMGTGTTVAQIKELGGGCTEDPWPDVSKEERAGLDLAGVITRWGPGRATYVCPVLDRVRRRGNLFASEQSFQEVV